MTEDDAEDTWGRPSKSARKREADSLQRLGVELSELPVDEIATLDLPEKLQGALLELKRLTSNGAKVRQRQYIGKLMRSIDAEPLYARLEAKKVAHDLEIRRFQRIERWRDRLLADDAALAELMAERAQADEAQLRSLIGRARHERDQQRAPTAARELFAVLRQLFA
jgi:ribosome-associated protein